MDIRADEVEPGDILQVRVVDVGVVGPERDIRLILRVVVAPRSFLDPNVLVRVAPYVKMAVIR